jgi:uncharacterized protein
VLVVLDTNVLLSALRADTTPPAAILDAWRKKRFLLVTSIEQINEFKRAARYPRLRAILPHAAVGRVVNHLRTADVLLKRMRRTGQAADPGDDFLLAMASATDADFLVTGDKALLSLGIIAATRIITPRRFAALLAR